MIKPWVKECVICERPDDLFRLEFKADDTDAGEEFSRYVCGSCWDVIATIARRAVKSMLIKEGAANGPCTGS